MTKTRTMHYIKNVAIGFDQLGNALAGGDPDETLSSRWGKATREGSCRFCYFMCRVLHVFDPGHCENSIEEDEGLEALDRHE